jgi:hypothetical protein
MRLCSHVVTHDTGLAPNPFYGFCTSAVCTPSHMRAKLEKGEWLIANSQNKDGNQLVYAMRISEMLSMNEYFDDKRFASKKPKPNGEDIEQCGDNIYHQDKDATWKRLPSRFHNDRGNFTQDVGTNRRGVPSSYPTIFTTSGTSGWLSQTSSRGSFITDRVSITHAIPNWTRTS